MSGFGGVAARVCGGAAGGLPGHVSRSDQCIFPPSPQPCPAVLGGGTTSLHGPRSPCPGPSMITYSPACCCPGSGLIRSPRAWVPTGPLEPSNRSFSLHACLSRASCAWKGRSVLGCPGRPGSGLWALPGGREPLGGSCCPGPWRLAFLGLAVGSRRTGVWQQARRPGSAV